jgi:hypothetical protein
MSNDIWSAMTATGGEPNQMFRGKAGVCDNGESQNVRPSLHRNPVSLPPLADEARVFADGRSHGFACGPEFNYGLETRKRRHGLSVSSVRTFLKSPERQINLRKDPTAQRRYWRAATEFSLPLSP